MDLFEGLDDDTNLSVKDMKERLRNFEATKAKEKSDLLSRIEQIESKFKDLGVEISSEATSGGSKESLNRVSFNYPKNTSPMPHILWGCSPI